MIASYFMTIENRLESMMRSAKEIVANVLDEYYISIVNMKRIGNKLEFTISDSIDENETIVIAYLNSETGNIRYQIVDRYIDGNAIYDELWGAGKNFETLARNLFGR